MAQRLPLRLFDAAAGVAHRVREPARFADPEAELHRYRAGDFGLDEGELAERFAFYTSRSSG